MKYINQFTKEDYINIHKFILPTVKFKENATTIEKESDESIQVTFYEEWDEGTKPCYLETRYLFTDFDKLKCLDTFGANIAKDYYRYMYNRFGEKYIHDYFEYQTEIKIPKKGKNNE